jgi:hypothetical protein
MLAEIMTHFKPEIGSLIRPGDSVEGGSESPAELASPGRVFRRQAVVTAASFCPLAD